MARELAPELVTGTVAAEPLAAALRAAFAMPEDRLRTYRDRAETLLEPLRPEAIERTVAEQVVPVLLA